MDSRDATRRPRLLDAALAAGTRTARTAGERLLLATIGAEAMADGSLACADALGLARRALEAADPTGERATVDLACATLMRGDAFAEAAAVGDGALRAELAYRQGRLDAADAGPWGVVAALERGVPAADLRDHIPLEATGAWLVARARLRAAAGEDDAALADALAAGQKAFNPAVLPWRGVAADLVLRQGDVPRATALADAELWLAARFGAPRAHGIALRTCGRVRGDHELLAQAVTVLAGAGAPLEHARALHEHGAALRRAGTRVAARELLREAADRAERLGATVLAARARDELAASGAKQRREQLSGPGSLTPSERRVAELAAAGRTNREIAAELVVTIRTVTTHLTHTYGKLGVTGRDELAAALAAAPPPAAEPVAPELPASPAPPLPDGPSTQDTVPAPDPPATTRLARLDDEGERAEAAAALADAYWHAGALDDAQDTIVAAIDELGFEADPALLAPLECLRLATILLGQPGAAHLAGDLPRLRMLAVAAGDAGHGLSVLLARWEQQRPGALRAPRPPALRRRRPSEPVLALAAAAKVIQDDIPGAHAALAELLEAADREGLVAARVHALTWGSHLALRTGRVTDALADARSACALADHHALWGVQPFAAAFCADAQLARGDVDAALAALRTLPHRPDAPVPAAYLAFTEGQALLAAGRRDDAVAALRRCRTFAAGTWADDPAALPSRSALAGALGDPALAEEELALARTGRSVRAIGVALIALGRHAEAADVLGHAPAPLALAAALAGADHRQDALDLALAAGATGLAARLLG